MRYGWVSLLILYFQAVALLWLSTPVHADGDYWVLVDSRRYTLSVFEGSRPIQTFRNIALGHGGVARNRRSGDGKTPIGTYFVAWINHDSRFRLFFGLDYPNDGQIEEAYVDGAIDGHTYFDLRSARAHHQLPSQETVLGGNIGIHGLGDRSPEFHRRYNWTEGCIALTNEQIDQLAAWVDLGTMVVIR